MQGKACRSSSSYNCGFFCIFEKIIIRCNLSTLLISYTFVCLSASYSCEFELFNIFLQFYFATFYNTPPHTTVNFNFFHLGASKLKMY